MSELIKRRDAAQATLDAVKGKPFRLGRNDCVRMAASHLRRMGHNVKLPPSGSYASLRGAVRELKARGYNDLFQALDDLGFERIAPAYRLPGDLVATPAESPIGSLNIVLNNGRVFGFHEDAVGATVMEPLEFVAAWRVPYAR